MEKMKKIIYILMAVIIAASLCACGEKTATCNADFDAASGTLTVSGTGELSVDKDKEDWADVCKREEIKKVVIEDGITAIGGEYAFAYCENLTDVEMPESLTVIGIAAFDYCSGLTEVHIPEGVKDIKQNAFAHCTALESVYIPTTVTDIRGYAFSQSMAVKEVHYAGTEEEWKDIYVASLDNGSLNQAEIFYNEK